ncbi:hypothetical protein VTJ83DRAFT_2090 [Remersonia thermophila]|uniref:CCAAT-binding factor domain-containing protein n=1 Tax=Remersonia thermophila TaxID=72144 RepID=A0ABR4DI02_9PEZI
MGAKRAKARKPSKPLLDEDALAQLTSRIDKSLADSEGQRPAKRKRPSESKDDHESKRRQTQTSGENATVHSRSDKKDARAVLLDEILALGGSEEDLELVANVDSGDEGTENPRPKASPEATVDKSLRDELSQLVQSLGFGNLRHNQDFEVESEVGSAEEDESDGTGEGDDRESDEEDTGYSDDENADADGDSDAGVASQGGEVTPPQQESQPAKRPGKLRFEPRPDWHGLSASGLSLRKLGKAMPNPSSITSLKAYADKLLDEDSSGYAASRASSSSQKFMSTIMSSGTLSDKISALTLSIQESPLHNRKAFDSLVGLAGKRSRGQAIAALGALVDLLGNGAVLPGDRRLYPFNAQPALLAELAEAGGKPWREGQRLPGKLTEPILMMWAFEDWLKSAYFRIIQLLEVWCSDEIEYSRSRALDFVFGLLKSKPEQEANLLRLLVNKLGDRERKIASRASYLLLQLFTIHPGMKTVVIDTVEQELLLKPGQTLRTRYTAINTLNQTILSMKEQAVADKLLKIYFDMFLSLLKSGSLGDFNAHDDRNTPANRQKKGKKSPSVSQHSGNEQDITQKLVSALLTGVNRAIPFSTTEGSTLEGHLDTLFRITHSSNFNTSIQALMLIQQLASTKHIAVDRFYRTLYESLLDPRLVTSSKHTLYLNLLYRAMKNDVNVRRVKAFVKRLIQILTLHQPSFTCGILFLISEMQASFPDLRTMLDEPEEDEDDGEEVYRDVPEDDVAAPSAPLDHDQDGENSRAKVYDGRKRDPAHSNAHRSCLWELTPFLAHYHPSVCLYADNLLSQQRRMPKPDLASHTLMHFLDRFVYRNPKTEASKRGGSIMQPVLAPGSTSNLAASAKGVAKQQPIVNSSSFWNLAADQVPAEDVFFHEYFTRIGKSGERPQAKNRPGVEQPGSDEEEAGEEEIWEALVNSRPEVDGMDVDEESDVDLEEYDYSDDEQGSEASEDSDKFSVPDSEGSGGFEGIFDDSGSDEEASAGESEDENAASMSGKAPSQKPGKGRLSRKEMKSLPTFASVDDYAELLAEEDGLDD